MLLDILASWLMGIWVVWPVTVLAIIWIIYRLLHISTASRRWWLILTCLLCAGLGRCRYIVANQSWQHQNTLALQPINQQAQTVVRPLDRRPTKAWLDLVNPQTGVITRAQVSHYANWLPGDRVSLSCKPEWPEPPAPYEFDYGQYLQRYGISGLCTWPKLIRLPGPAPPLSARWQSWLLTRQLAFQDAISRLLPEPEASFLAGLLVGARSDMPVATTESLRRTGTTHLIAVSGANVAIISGSVLYLIRLLTGRRELSFWLTLFIIIGFVIFTGCSAAAVRGGWVASISLTAQHLGRRARLDSLVLLPAAVSLTTNPFICHDVGWQLSFAAFSGIAVLGPWLQTRLQKLPAFLAQPAAETLAASLPTAPVAMYQFGTFSLTSLLTNPAVLWIIPIATFAGLISLVGNTILPPLFVVWRIIAWLPLHLALWIISTTARLPFFWQW